MKDIVLITGATGGVGASLCHHLCEEFEVLALARSQRKLSKLVEQLPAVTPIVADMESSSGLQGVLDAISTRYGYIPYIINNAGVNLPASLTELTDEALSESLQVNALAPLGIMRHFLPLMHEHDFGRIINITSGAPFNCFAGYGAYSASKAALNALTITAANEYASRNIKINLMSPGPVRSGMAPAADLDPSVCHPTIDYLLRLGKDGPTGRFFWLGHEIPLLPDHEGIDWLQGRAPEKYRINGDQAELQQETSRQETLQHEEKAR
ncbi:SDR family oxidoreductase [uncultured Halomonas sp.]|uniref:SDR family NAD(P)-dependent oxidoreductase n=1 Tax=uncultured Halomonas sp. TaxID=173971 RepID=UPI002601D063|nr:SDR family oxidoreductase [uncultured Halomonas sp.]